LIVPVILSGGMGTRLWPFSRNLQPKQLMAFGGESTLLQDTASRLNGLKGASAPIVVCNEAHRFVVAEQLRSMGCTGAEVVLEPVGRNTAPAIAVGAHQALSRSQDAVLLVMPADHRIGVPQSFWAAIQRGMLLANQGWLVVFGITPEHPETGYGYIRSGAALDDVASEVDAFVEKPDLRTAKEYLASGDYLWNSGLFLFKASAYLEALKAFEPEMFLHSKAAYEGRSQSDDFIRLDEEAFGRCPANSIDYAVMERSEQVAVVPLDCDWTDLGAWSAVWEDAKKDAQGNALIGDATALKTRNTLVYATHRLVTAVGVEDVAIVETGDAVLVVGLKEDQAVKQLVATLHGREEVHAHLTVRRPWGSYTRLGEQDGFQVKRIVVQPGAILSLQKHQHRSEHWMVVSGVARVTNGDEVFDLSAPKHTFIPAGTVHRLENVGNVPLELIEVQLGDYLGEDDIIRLEDRYGRG
jgi:mannose-1-phosphate guanylyltransferase/mannose-6-phosphate isomerase